MKRRILYLVAAFIWGVPGLMITTKGIRSYTAIQRNDLWWLLLITACITASFYVMFKAIVKRYSNRIASLPNERVMIWQTFSLRGWSVLCFMMMLGFILRSLPYIPEEFIASFYSGLGPMLLLSSIRFAGGYCKE